jgi:hypothetical protein
MMHIKQTIIKIKYRMCDVTKVVGLQNHPLNHIKVG